MDMNSRMAMAEKLSVQQLQQAVQSGSLPAYIGIPLIEQKTKEKAQMAAAQGGQQKPPSVAASILQQAEQQEMQDQGIDRLPSNLPVMDDQEMGMAGGGIVAFAQGDLVEYSKIPTTDLTEAEFNALPPKEQERRIREEQGVSGFGTAIFNQLKALPEAIGQGSFDPLRNASDRGFQTGYKNTEAKVRGGLRTHDPVAEGASPTIQENEGDPLITALRQDPLAQFSGLTPETLTADTARIEKIKADRAAAEEKQRREFLSKAAPHMLPPVIESGEIEDPRLATGIVGVPNKGTGQRGPVNPNAPTGGTPNAPTARQAAPTAQAPEAQPEGQSALDKYAAMLMAEREGSGKERDKAKAMAILQAGLGIMGGTSPNALANIAQGALPATQAYQQSIKGIRAEDAARLKELMGLGVSKEKLALEAKKLGISEKRFDQMYQLETQKIGIMGGSRADAAKNSEALRRDQLAANYFKTLYDKNPMATPQELEAMEATARRLARTADGSGTDVIPTISSQSEYTKLPKGTQYRDPNGVLRTKG
jgi:hypothetical protein